MSKLNYTELTAEQLQLLQKKNQRRAELRNVYLKNMHDPHRPAGGHLFDPAVMRFQAMKVSHFDYFKATTRTVRLGFLIVFLPIIGFAQLFTWERGNRERKIRNGEVAYEDRLFKFI